MSFSDWIIIEGTAWLIKNGMKKAAANREESAEEYIRYWREIQIQKLEWNRRCAVNTKRRNMPCFFDDGLSLEAFKKMAKRARRKIKRIKFISVNDGIIYCNVESQTGYSYWNFSVDFNDWGHITGTYWIKTDNDDSSIPNHYGQMISGWIHDFYRKKEIDLLDLSDYVDKNKDLETERGLNYTYKENLFKRTFGRVSNLIMNYGTDKVLGEHLYPVISMLRKTGFKNIKTFSVKDVNDSTTWYPYQVEQVIINGIGYFDAGMIFSETSQVYITYHEKQTICMPFSHNELKRKNYRSVESKLREQGYTQIYERKIEDLITGWIIREGSVESVLVDEDENIQVKKNAVYDYDQKIIICYHTKKPKG